MVNKIVSLPEIWKQSNVYLIRKLVVSIENGFLLYNWDFFDNN